MKLSRRAIDGQQFRQVFWACAINDRETLGGKLIILVMRNQCSERRRGGNMAMLWRLEDNTCSVILIFFFFWVCLKGTLGFQQEESYSNWFLREQKHRSEFWLRQQKDNGEWYGFCGTLGMLLCKCSRPAAWKMMFDLEWHGGCKQVEKKKYRLDWSALKEGEKKGLETSQRCSSQIWVNNILANPKIAFSGTKITKIRNTA